MSTSLQVQTNNIKKLLEVSKKEIAAALPKHLTPDRMLRIAVTEVRKNPELLNCTPASFIGAIIQCAQLGLEPGGLLGHVYLIPFNNKKAKVKEVQALVGYRGYLEIAGRSDRVSRIIARSVYSKDKFSYEFGTSEKLTHIGSMDEDRGDITHFYAQIFLKDGSCIFDVASFKEMQKYRKELAPSEYGPWYTDFPAMCHKTLIRRLFKFSPVSIEIQKAIGFDEAADRGEQDNGSFIEVDAPVSETDAARDALRGKTALPPSEAEPSEEDLALPVSDK